MKKIDTYNPAAVAKEKAYCLRQIRRLMDECARRCDMDTATQFGDIVTEVEYQLESATRDSKE